MTLGQRLGDVRRRRGFTQEQLAEAAEVSVSTIRKLERDERDGARMATMGALATALDVSTSALLEPGAPEPVRDDPYKMDLLRFRQVLMPAPSGETSSGDVPDLDQLWRRFEAVNRSYTANAFGEAARLLPDVLADTRRAADSCGDGRSRELLCYVLHVTGSLLTSIRQYDLAYFPLAEAIRTADEGGDQLTAAYVTSALCWLLMRQGRLDEAEQVAAATADRVEPRMSRARPEEIGAWGRLLLFGASAAVRNNRDSEAEEMLSLADAGAGRLSTVHHHSWAAVGPFDRVTVARRRVEHAMIKGDYRRALDVSAGIDGNDAPTSVNRNRYLLDVAAAHVAARDYAEAFGVLRQIRRNIPEWITHQTYARDTFSRILDARARPVTDDARDMADLLGLT